MQKTHLPKKEVTKERASDRGIAILIAIMRITGPSFIKVLVAPVAFYYFLTSRKSRQASIHYLEHLRQCQGSAAANHRIVKSWKWWFGYRHILSFAQSIVDRVCSWTPGSNPIEYEVDGQAVMDSILGDKSNGGIIFISHLGNFDLAIARKDLIPDKRFNIVMDTSQTQTYNKYRNKLFQSGQVSFMEPDSITPMKTMELIEKVGNGEIIVIAADRIQSFNTKNSVAVNFMGDMAAFPSGPYILAHLLEAPVYVLFALQKKGKCLIRFEEFERQIVLTRKNRQEDLRRYAEKFAARLQKECLLFPLQWYNFYDFWAESETKKS